MRKPPSLVSTRPSFCAPPGRAWNLHRLGMNILERSLKQILERTPHLPARFYDVLHELHPDLSNMIGNRKRQSEMFARTLIALVDRYDDKPWIDDQLAALGAHHQRLGLTADSYRRFDTALLVSLEEPAGEGWTVEVEAAWVDALRRISDAMQQAPHATGAD